MENKTEKKDNPIFAFLPEMVLDHLNEAKPTEITKENSNEPTTKKITISAEPEIPNLDSIIIESSTTFVKEFIYEEN